MADNSMTFSNTLMQLRGEDFLRELTEFMLNRIMEADVTQRINAEPHERSDERETYRNGYRDRQYNTRLGTLDLRIPKLREGSYFPSFLEARRLSEKALNAVIQEAWINGVSTRKVDALVQSMGMTGISRSQVSSICRGIDERVQAFLHRPLEGEWPYLWLDATYVKVRKNGRVVSVAVIIACAVNLDGRREIIGMGIGESEAKAFWLAFLLSLKERGLEGVKLVISDSHSGLKAAYSRCSVPAGSAAGFTSCATCWAESAEPASRLFVPPCNRCSCRRRNKTPMRPGAKLRPSWKRTSRQSRR